MGLRVLSVGTPLALISKFEIKSFVSLFSVLRGSSNKKCDKSDYLVLLDIC